MKAFGVVLLPEQIKKRLHEIGQTGYINCADDAIALIDSLTAEVKKLGADYVKMADSYHIELIQLRTREAELVRLLRESKCPQLLCADGLVPVFTEDRFNIENCKWCIERDLAVGP
jgi:hypothetical protein